MTSCVEVVKKLSRVGKRAGQSTVNCLSRKRLGDKDPKLIRGDLNLTIGPELKTALPAIIIRKVIDREYQPQKRVGI